MIGPVFRELLNSPVEKPHDRCGLDNPLSFQLQNDLQHPMRTGMLRAHVEQQFLSPEGRQRLTLWVLGVHPIDGGSLIFKGLALRDILHNAYRAVSFRNSNVSRHPFPCSGKSFLNG